jgi:hypothetical protein
VSEPTPFRVGDKLWYVDRFRRSAGMEVTVTKIGRSYVTLSNFERFDKNGHMDTENGTVHLSRESCETDMRTHAMWQSFCHQLPFWRRPPGLDEAAIREIAERCGVTL